MYYIIGADKNQYGPVSAEVMKQWLNEGRVNGQTLVHTEGQDWQPLSAFPEFAEELAAKILGAPPPSAFSSELVPSFEPLESDYSLDIGGCIGAGWRTLSGNFGMMVGGVVVFMIIQVVIWGLCNIPIVGLLFSAASFVVAGPLTGGLWYFVLKIIRHEPVDIGDLFAGFKYAFGQLVLGYLVIVLLTLLAALPGIVLLGVPVLVMVHHQSADAVHVMIALAGAVLALLPMLYLGIGWTFTLPLIIDKRMQFWPAMQLGRKRVGKHWWVVLGMVMVCGLVNLAGFFVCCVGLVVSMPVALAAMMHAYETIFSGRPPAAT